MSIKSLGKVADALRGVAHGTQPEMLSSCHLERRDECDLLRRQLVLEARELPEQSSKSRLSI
jgi:hypothetical protein